jgi:hypothetical protein
MFLLLVATCMKFEDNCFLGSYKNFFSVNSLVLKCLSYVKATVCLCHME